jgi:hypothetical protein
MEAGAIMTFFSVRSIPETTTASFAVDLLVMVAVYIYLERLTLAAQPLLATAEKQTSEYGTRHRRIHPGKRY